MELSSDARKRAEQLVQDALPVVKEIAEEGRAIIKQAEAEAYGNLARLSQVEEELEGVERHREAVSHELSGMPTRLARATLEGDEAGERRIKDAYKRLSAELESLEEKRRTLEGEAAQLRGPNGRAEMFQRHKITVALTEAMKPLHQLTQLSNAVQNALHGLQGRALTHRGESEALNTQRLSDTQRQKHVKAPD